MLSPVNELFKGSGQPLTVAPEQWAPWMVPTDGSTRDAAEIRKTRALWGVSVCPRSETCPWSPPKPWDGGSRLGCILPPSFLAARHEAGPHPGRESERHRPPRVMVFQHFDYQAVGENSLPGVRQEIELHKHRRHIPARLPSQFWESFQIPAPLTFKESSLNSGSSTVRRNKTL